MASSNPFSKPVIDLGLLTSEFDEYAIVQAMKDAQLFIKAHPWNGFIHSPFGELADVTTDKGRAAFAHKFGFTVNHPAGTAAMSPAKVKWGVVSPQLSLKGAVGLRVVDASVFVSCTSLPSDVSGADHWLMIAAFA